MWEGRGAWSRRLVRVQLSGNSLESARQRGCARNQTQLMVRRGGEANRGTGPAEKRRTRQKTLMEDTTAQRAST